MVTEWVREFKSKIWLKKVQIRKSLCFVHIFTSWSKANQFFQQKQPPFTCHRVCLDNDILFRVWFSYSGYIFKPEINCTEAFSIWSVVLLTQRCFPFLFRSFPWAGCWFELLGGGTAQELFTTNCSTYNSYGIIVLFCEVRAHQATKIIYWSAREMLSIFEPRSVHQDCVIPRSCSLHSLHWYG